MKTIIVFISLFILSACSSLMYFPSQKKFYDPGQVQLEPTDIYFQNYSGQRIHAWWFESKIKPSKGTIVFFHGNAENLTSHFVQLSWLPKEGYSYFIFDYPGYGDSEGSANTESVVKTGADAIRWVHDNKDQRPLVIYGQSIGGISCLGSLSLLKKEIPLRAIVVDSSFPSYQRIARQKMSQHWLTWLFQPLAYFLISDNYAPKDLAALAPIPVLIVHGQSDRVVEPFWSEEIFAQLNEPKEIWRIPNANHIQTYWIDSFSYRSRFVKYLESHP